MAERQKIAFIENVRALKPQGFYCETNLPNENAIRECFFDHQIIIVRHCLRLKLLHIYGPYKNAYVNTNIVTLVAESLSGDDDQRKLLISVQMFQNEYNNNNNNKDFRITYDLVNVMFTLKNFLTLPCNEKLHWVPDEDVQCEISATGYYKVTLVVASEFGSVIKFHKDYSDSSDSECEQMPVVVGSPRCQVSMIDNSFEGPDDFDWSATPLSQNASTNTTIVDVLQKTETHKMIKNFEKIISLSKSRIEEEIFDSSQNSTVHCSAIAANIVEQQQQNSDSDEPSVEHFIQNNIPVLSGEEIEITSLSKIVYPSNEIQMYNFVNIVGIIRKVFMQFNELLIIDETVGREFKIKLLTKGIDWFKAKNVYINSNKKEFGQEKSTIVKYPPLRCGDIVCIRELCLTLQSTNLCAHPDQLTVVELHKENDLIVTSDHRKISAEELKYTARLALYNAQLLLSSAVGSFGDRLTKDLVGQVLAVKDFHAKQYSELYILLPQATDKPTYLDENDETFILEHIRNMTFDQNRLIYGARTINELKSRKQIIKIIVYENHREILQNIMALDLAVLYNVHVKKERYFNGFFLYIMHGGDDYGRRIASVHHKSILGKSIMKKINPILEEIPIIFKRTLIVDHLEQNGGTNERKMICSTQNHARTGILTMKKSMKYGGKQDRELLKSFVNTESAVRVADFEELLSLEKDSGPNQLYRVVSYVSDHDFEDEKNGLAYLNMAHLRKNRLKMVCTSTECDETVPFVSYFLPKAFDLMKENLPKDTSTNCPKCGSIMSPYLSVGLDLMDQRGKYLSVLLSSPECEGLVGYPNQDLVFACPADESFCKSFNYALETLCPIRSLNCSHFWPSPPTTNDDHDEQNNDHIGNGEISGKKLITGADVNPKLDWILESVEKSGPDPDDRIFMKPKDVEICQSKFDYHVRCIIINE